MFTEARCKNKSSCHEHGFSIEITSFDLSKLLQPSLMWPGLTGGQPGFAASSCKKKEILAQPSVMTGVTGPARLPCQEFDSSLSPLVPNHGQAVLARQLRKSIEAGRGEPACCPTTDTPLRVAPLPLADSRVSHCPLLKVCAQLGIK